MVRGYSKEYEKEYIKKDGTLLPITIRSWLTKDKQGKSIGTWAIMRDITERKKAIEEIEKLAKFPTENPNPVLRISKDGTVLHHNHSSESLLEHWHYKEGKPLQDRWFQFVLDALKDDDIKTVETEIGDKVISLTFAPIVEKDFVNVYGLDITERKEAEEKVLYLSYHDQLTGLYNRRFYEEELRRLDTERNYPITLVMLDINGLKLTNDAFGHQVGDLLLEKAAKVLKMECRADEIVARIGGDEFVLLLPKTDEKEANQIIERINVAINKEKIDQAILSVSIGFAVKQDASDDMTKVFKKAEDDMYRHKLSESSSMRSKTIDLIMNSLYIKSHREMLHSKRVSDLCEAIAIKMNFKKDDINRLRIAGLMHDIGKIGIPDHLLNKMGKLDGNKRNEMERHSEVGYRILSSVNEFSEIADYVLEHHERWDGKGYPGGIKGEDISLQARIIAIADSYDAMTSDRTYWKRLRKKEARDEIRRFSGKQFDPEIVKIFIEKVLGKVW